MFANLSYYNGIQDNRNIQFDITKHLTTLISQQDLNIAKIEQSFLLEF